VRIGDSPFAPIFEVVEKPNDWERQVKSKAKSSEGASYYDVKQQFREALIERHPALAQAGFRPWRYPNNYVTVHDDPQIDISVFIGKNASGIFVRSRHSQPAEPVISLLEPFATDLGSRTGTDSCLMANGIMRFSSAFPKAIWTRPPGPRSWIG